MILVYITNPTKKEAQKIAKLLLKERLIACANIFEIESLYWWEGKIETSKEFVLIGKTIEKNYNKIKKKIKEIHPYKIPCILKIKADANSEFLNWVNKEVKNSVPAPSKYLK
jgi:periplasmic divalent cation tolerance protein